jgi:hypothetical protein
MRPKLPALLQMALSNVFVNIANQFVDSDDDSRFADFKSKFFRLHNGTAGGHVAAASSR